VELLWDIAVSVIKVVATRPVVAARIERRVNMAFSLGAGQCRCDLIMARAKILDGEPSQKPEWLPSREFDARNGREKAKQRARLAKEQGIVGRDSWIDQ
jgi:hypothetical protein